MEIYNPKSWKSDGRRWLGLLMISFTKFSIMYCFETIQAIQDPLMKQFSISTEQYGLICSVQYLPGLFFCPLVGYLSNKYSQRVIFAVFFSFFIIGQIGATISAYLTSYSGMLASKLVGGIGNDPTLVLVMNFALAWAKSTESSRASTLCNVLGRLGCILTLFLSPKLFLLQNSIFLVFFFGLIVLVVDVFVSAIFIQKDQQCDILASEKREKTERSLKGTWTHTEINQEEKEDPIISIELSIMSYGVQEPFLKDSKKTQKFKPGFYVLCVYVSVFYLSFYGFFNVENSLVMALYGWSNNQAGNILPVYFISFILFAPVVSKLLDKTGQFLKGLVLSQIIFILSFLFMLFCKTQHSYVLTALPLAALGLASVIHNSALYGGLPHTSEGNQGLALGIIMALECLAIMISPLIVGFIVDSAPSMVEGYVHSVFLFIGITTTCLLALFASFYIKDTGL